MTREEARKAAEVMLAYADGKEIEFLADKGHWSSIAVPEFDWYRNYYRIKPEPTYRPFRSKEECWQEMQRHQPFGWVINDEIYDFIAGVSESSCCNDIADYDYEKALKIFTFADGTPFGVKE